MKLIFEQSKEGRKGFFLPQNDGIQQDFPAFLKRKEEAKLPELAEIDVVRHFTNLSHLNFSVDTHFYPLGSCTMKYNPKITEVIASLKPFRTLHPATSLISGLEKYITGALEVIFELEKLLAEITGMQAVSISPMAGAHGELAGIMVIAAYHKAKGNNKKTVIVPDSSHGTNPASAAMAGFEVITIPSLPNGEMDIEAFQKALNNEVAAVMMTCPNTLGIFETQIKKIAELAHSVDALMYYDGANLNAILGKVRPGDLGFDVVHVNVHKTFGTPHGGGGPGAGPIGVSQKLASYLPLPRVIKNKENQFIIEKNNKDSIGYIAPFFGNYGVLLKAYAYILLLGKEGLKQVSEDAVLNANYILKSLKQDFDLPYDRVCMHECVFSAKKQLKNGVHAVDIAKYLIDNHIHPPTVYFPLIVKEAMMIEPTETESKETLDYFILIMKKIAELAEKDPEQIKNAPSRTLISRPDETKAAREMKLRY